MVREALVGSVAWTRPPVMKNLGDGLKAIGYDASQRAYLWPREAGARHGVRMREADDGATLKATIEASEESPIENLCLVIEGWDDTDPEVLLDGRPADVVRFGRIRRLEGDGLAIWIELRSTCPVALEIRGGDGGVSPHEAVSKCVIGG